MRESILYVYIDRDLIVSSSRVDLQECLVEIVFFFCFRGVCSKGRGINRVFKRSGLRPLVWLTTRGPFIAAPRVSPWRSSSSCRIRRHTPSESRSKRFGIFFEGVVFCRRPLMLRSSRTSPKSPAIQNRRRAHQNRAKLHPVPRIRTTIWASSQTWYRRRNSTTPIIGPSRYCPFSTSYREYCCSTGEHGSAIYHRFDFLFGNGSIVPTNTIR